MKKNKDKIQTPTEEEIQQDFIEEKTSEQIINELNEQVKVLQEENMKLLEKVKIAQAELVNYRVRKDEETSSKLKYANKDLILEIIPVIDNFERAIKTEKEDVSDDIKKYYTGIKMIYAGLVDALNKFGVEEISRLGEVFDPNQEQAILTETVEDKEDEIVLQVLLKGYKLKDRIIRPASVVINQK